MDQDLGDAKCFGDSDRMLATSATKGSQSMLRGVVSPCLSQAADGPRHGLVGDLDETVRHFVQTHGLVCATSSILIDLLRQLLKKSLACLLIKPFVFVLAKDLWEEVG